MISDTKLQESIKWQPHGGGQEQVINCDNREVLICAGRGWGKSMLMAYLVVKEFLAGLGRVKRGESKSIKIFIIAPTYGLCEKVFNYVVQFLLTRNKRFQKSISSRPTPNITLSVNQWIKSVSTTEPTGMLGERVDIAIVDEAALIPERIYHQNIRPITASATKKGKTYYISTPRGEGWFKKKFSILKDQNAAFQFKSTDGVEVSEEELEIIKKDTPELLFRQEYLAEFVSDAGIVFRNLEDIIVPKVQILRDAVMGHHYLIGVDLAEEQDYTVMTVIDTTTKQVVHQDRFKGRDYPLQKKQIIAKAQRYNNARVIIDATGVGKPVYEDLRVAGIFVEDFTFSGKRKEELIGNLIVNVEEKYIRIPDIEVLIDEMKAFEYKYLNEKTGEKLRNIQYGAPQGYHDDCVDSLALACWGLNPGKPREQNKLKEEIKKRSEPLLKTYI